MWGDIDVHIRPTWSIEKETYIKQNDWSKLEKVWECEVERKRDTNAWISLHGYWNPKSKESGKSSWSTRNESVK